MSDALAAAPVADSGDAIGEVTSLPNPQTNTIPLAEEKAPGDKRSDAINRAIDKALDEKPSVKAEDKLKPEAKAKAEPAKVDAVKPEAAKEAIKPAAQPQEAPLKADAATEAPKRPTAYREPPAGFDDAAKSEWEAVPETVRGATHRRVQELERGIEKYRQTAQEYEPVKQYAEMAKQSGTTLDQALSRYVAMEQQLRQDPITGLQAVVANLGLKKPDGSAVTLRDFAAMITGQTPDKTASQQEATIMRLTQQLQEVTQKIGGFQQHVEAQQMQAKTATAESEWGAFQRENPRAAELEPMIADFLTKYPAAPNMPIRERLADAYAWAVAKTPEGAHTAIPPLVQTQIEATPNPAGQKSISGAPGGTDAKTVSRNLNRSAAVEKAMRAAGL